MRQEFSKKVKLQAFERAGGHCENCTAYLTPGRYHYDHRLPAALGGKATLENCQVLCNPCHQAKTAKEDVPQIAKADRARAAHLGAKTPKGRPMVGSRASGWRKRMDGTAERRE